MLVDDVFAYFTRQDHNPTKQEMYLWTALQMNKRMMVELPFTYEDNLILEAIVLSLPWEEDDEENETDSGTSDDSPVPNDD
tara:strand:+ start:105 stop:347 length:243 start_codon:yes stop_codon:yes gene_type:complete